MVPPRPQFGGTCRNISFEEKYTPLVLAERICVLAILKALPA